MKKQSVYVSWKLRKSLIYNLNKFFGKINTLNNPVMLMSSSKRLFERDTIECNYQQNLPQGPQ